MTPGDRIKALRLRRGLYDDRPVEELEMEADKAGVIPLFHISA